MASCASHRSERRAHVNDLASNDLDDRGVSGGRLSCGAVPGHVQHANASDVRLSEVVGGEAGFALVAELFEGLVEIVGEVSGLRGARGWPACQTVVRLLVMGK